VTEGEERPRVLVVEDDAVMRYAAVDMVADAGFEPLEAADGTQAMRVLDTATGIRAVVTDIDMPSGLDGIRLAACIHARWPAIGVIVVSGKAVPVPGDIPARPDFTFLRKPYAEEHLVALLRRILQTPAPSGGLRPPGSARGS
jgi:DNA-binding NtrC family response regulator